MAKVTIAGPSDKTVPAGVVAAVVPAPAPDVAVAGTAEVTVADAPAGGEVSP